MAYNQRYKSAYDVTKLTEGAEAGVAVIDAFFTAKPSAVYAILPHWPGKQFTLKQMDGARVKSVTLLGMDQPLAWHANGGSVTVDLPAIPNRLMSQPAWVLKVAE